MRKPGYLFQPKRFGLESWSYEALPLNGNFPFSPDRSALVRTTSPLERSASIAMAKAGLGFSSLPARSASPKRGFPAFFRPKRFLLGRFPNGGSFFFLRTKRSPPPKRFDCNGQGRVRVLFSSSPKRFVMTGAPPTSLSSQSASIQTPPPERSPASALAPKRSASPPLAWFSRSGPRNGGAGPLDWGAAVKMAGVPPRPLNPEMAEV